jgi:hypothetical protein
VALQSSANKAEGTEEGIILPWYIVLWFASATSDACPNSKVNLLVAPSRAIPSVIGAGFELPKIGSNSAIDFARRFNPFTDTIASPQCTPAFCAGPSSIPPTVAGCGRFEAHISKPGVVELKIARIVS